MKKYFEWKNLSAKWNKFHLADRCLLVIMAILMAQTAHNLFFHQLTVQDSTIIDVVIRTTTAAIFGYFISGNFHSGRKSILENKDINARSLDIEPSSDIGSRPKARIGFSANSEVPELHDGNVRNANGDDPDRDNNTQIIIIASIGIICLIFLIIVRNYSTPNQSSVATLSQLRDFISGSVGFLIGQSTQNKKSS